jgi:steroid delta-isomerase-like uncharacterized protein
MLSKQNMEVVIRHVEAETAHDMTGTLETLVEDCVFDDRGFGRVWHGRAGAGAYYKLWWDAFEVVPDTEDRWAPEEDLLIVETIFRGRHKGDFLGIAPTGRTIAVPMTIYVGFRDGLLSGEKFYWSLTGLMEQLGEPSPWPVDRLAAA